MKWATDRRVLTALAVLSLWSAIPAAADDVLPPCWRGQPGTTRQQWRFDTSANPATPQILSNANGAPALTVALGQAAAGWVNQLFIFGTNQGVWDLGLNGTMTLNVPNEARPAGSWKIVWVQVYQYQDGIFSQLASVAVPGASLVSTQSRTNATTSFGGNWIEHRSAWLIQPSPASETIIITGGTNGAPTSAIDQVVVDTLPLSVTCPTNQTVIADAGQCSRAGVTWTLPVVDGCVFTNITCTPPNGSTFNTGVTPVSCVIRDAYGHIVNCSFTVTVADNQPPAANCPGNLTIAANPGLCGEFATFNATATDNCPGVTILCTPPSGSFFPSGSTTVTCTAQDQAGLTSQCSFTVTVTAPPSLPGDSSPPCWRGRPDTTHQGWAFSTPANPALPEILNNPNGQPYAIISPGAFSDGWQNQIPGLGCRQGIWDLGTNGTIRLDVTNRAGAASSEKYLRLQIVQWQDGALYSQLAAVIFPNIPGAVLVSHPPVTVVETIPGVGRWVVDQQVWRIAPCPETELIQLTGGPFGALIDEVIVDTLCQNLLCPSDVSLNADTGECFASGISWTLPAVDACLIPSVACTTNGVAVTQPASFPIGTTPVTCVIVDAESQSRTCTFNVTVLDNQAPLVASCPSPQTASALANCLAPVPDFTVGLVATDCSGPLSFSQSPLAGTMVGPGAHPVTITTTDPANNATTCLTTFTVSDTTAPDINIGQSFGNGEITLECGLGWGFTIPILTDNCDLPGSITLNIFSTATNAIICGNSFTATRVWQAIDTSGNTAYATQIVHQVDHTPPQITTCPPNTTLACFSAVPAPDISLVIATDHCDGGFGVYPPVAVVVTHVSDVTSGINPKIITRTYQAADSCTNIATCTQVFTVHDTELPQFTCPAVITNNADPGQCFASVTLAPLVATDNCGILSITSNAPSLFPVGNTPVIWTVVDINFNTNTCTQLVVVLDNQLPQFVCPAPVTNVADLAQCSATFILPALAATDNCAVASVSSNAPAAFPVGSTTVTWTVIDVNDNTNLCTQLVVIRDSQAPSVTTCPVAQMAPANLTCQAQTPNFALGLSASDNCTPAANLHILQIPPAGTTVGLGTHTITLVVNDASSNAVVCSTTFTVTDTTAPAIATCAPGQSANADLTCAALVPNFIPGVVATDCNGPVVITQSPAAGSSIGLGVHPIVLTVTDASGNANTCSTTFTVTDTSAPAIATCAPGQSANADPTCAALVPNFIPGVVATDCNGPLVITQSPAAGSSIGLGVHPIVLTVTDASGNANTCSTTFTVTDTTAPAIATCPAGQSVNADLACAAVVPNFVPGVVATDCNGPLVITQSPAAGSAIGLGVHPIVLTVTDAAGNATTCSTTFTVNPSADLAVEISAAPASVTVGEPVTYSLTVTNLGGCAATDVLLSHLLSPGQILVSYTNIGAGTMSACPTPGAVAWWSAEGNAQDRSGASHGTIVGGTSFSAGQVAQAFAFDGLTGHITIPDAPALRPFSLTVEGWIMIQDPNGLHVIVSKPRGSGTEESFSLWIASGTLHAAVSDGSGVGTFLTYPDFPSSSLFVFSDIVNLPSLAAKLQVPADPVSLYLSGLLSPATQNLLTLYGGGPNAPLQRAIIADFNQIIQSGPVYDIPRFAGVTLAPETSYLLGRNPTGIDLVRLNRLLIRDAYPAEIGSILFPQLNQWHHVAYTFDDTTKVQALYVNGKLVDVGIVNKTITYDNSPLLIAAGNNNGNAGFFYQGKVDELAIYNRALVGVEVEAIHAAGASGKCAAAGPLALGSIAPGGFVSVTLVTIPIQCPSVSIDATVSSATFDPVAANNTATASATVEDISPSALQLSIRRVSLNNNFVRISWPLTCAPYLLEGTADLNAPILWTPSTSPIEIINGSRSTVLHADDAHKFFRLRNP